MAVCPAGEDVIGPYLASKKDFADDVMRPLQAKREPVYVVRGSDAETHVQKRYPHKTVRQVRSSSRPRNIASLLFGMRLSFQRHAAGKLDATYHFVFTGNESAEATVTVRAGRLTVENGLLGQPNLKVIADSETWRDSLRASGIFCGRCSRAASGCKETRSGCWRSNAVSRREFELIYDQA
jgi:hypothetical protein